jgi:hypothetical protein
MLLVFLLAHAAGGMLMAAQPLDYSPRVEERQLPNKMHSAMGVLPLLKVGHADADIVGADNRALQAAVDYIAGLGGGVVEIGPGDYLIENNGAKQDVAGIRIRGETRDIILKNNRIRDTRSLAAQKQSIGIQLDEQVGPVVMENNEIQAKTTIKDQRRTTTDK